MSRLLILGGDGMLGHKLFQKLRQRFSDTTCTIRGAVGDQLHRHISLLQVGGVHEGIDALDIAGVERLLLERQPDVIINCIGVIKQRDQAHAAIPSITINSLLPHRLAEIAATYGGRLIHFSTDCVFSGQRGGYLESDPSDAEDLYGKSKYLGEVATENAVTLRTSIIGRELFHFASLLEWFLNQNGKPVRGFTRAIYSGVTTNHLAEIVERVIIQWPHLSGLYQVSSQPISKYDLLLLLKEAYQLDIPIQPDDSYFCDRSMNGSRFYEATGYQPPPWPVLVDELAQDMTPYSSWRDKR